MKPDSRRLVKKIVGGLYNRPAGVRRYRIRLRRRAWSACNHLGPRPDTRCAVTRSSPRREQSIDVEHQLGVAEGLPAFGAFAVRIERLRTLQRGLEPHLSLFFGALYRIRRRLVAELRADCLRPHRAGVRFL